MRNDMSELEILLTAKTNCIWIQTEEEADCINDILDMVKTTSSRKLAVMGVNAWSYAEGLRTAADFDNPNMQAASIPALFEGFINPSIENERDNIWIIKDGHGQHFGSQSNQKLHRYLRDIMEYENKNKVYNPVIVISPTVDIHEDLAHLFEVITYDTPNLHTIKGYIVEANNRLIRMEKNGNNTMHPLSDDEIVEYAKLCVGMTRLEIERLLRKSSVKYHAIDKDMLVENKIQIVRKTGALDYKIPKITIKDIGGHQYLKEWLKRQQRAYSEEARIFGIDLPKGYMSVGLAGCGKTALAEAFAGEMNVPLLSLSMSKVMSRMVGESERKIAKALQVVKSCAPCVFLLDEVEKMVGGIASSNSSDSGITARVFQELLKFMNDNEHVYVIMTSNNITQLPPEFTRAGRLDKTWFFNFPEEDERKEIFKIHLEKNGFEATEALINCGAENSNKYTGAEIEQAVKNAKLIAFDRYLETGEKKLTMTDLITGINEVIPIYRSAREQVSFCTNYCLEQGRASATNKLPEPVKMEEIAQREFSIEDAF